MNQLAVSLAGHDKGSIYAIVREESGCVFIADGKSKTLQKPKKKNPMHIRRICHLPVEIIREMEKVSTDSDLVHVLRLYQAYQKEKGKR